MQDFISYKVYAARLFSKYFLALSTFLNNYGLLHLVHDKYLLMPESLRPIYDKYVKAGTILFPIKSHGTRIIKNIIKNLNGSTSNLILHDMAVVDNFHCNIVSDTSWPEQKCGFAALMQPLGQEIYRKTG
jgi:hypothetical protein